MLRPKGERRVFAEPTNDRLYVCPDGHLCLTDDPAFGCHRTLRHVDLGRSRVTCRKRLEPVAPEVEAAYALGGQQAAQELLRR